MINVWLLKTFICANVDTQCTVKYACSAFQGSKDYRSKTLKWFRHNNWGNLRQIIGCQTNFQTDSKHINCTFLNDKNPKLSTKKFLISNILWAWLLTFDYTFDIHFLLWIWLQNIISYIMPRYCCQTSC